MISKLDQLRKVSVVVADTVDVASIERFSPTDCTTNPSLVLSAVGLPAYREMIDQAVRWGKSCNGTKEEIVKAIADRIRVLLIAELAKALPGRVSTEVDADLSFDVARTVDSGISIIASCEELGIAREKVLIKIAATWEGIMAAKILEQKGINTNLTLVFSLAQAKACAEAGVFVISPFVGRIGDWYEKRGDKHSCGAAEDPGAKFVREVFGYYKAVGAKTEVMAASLRSTDQVEALAGCDRLTISPGLLEQMASDMGDLTKSLDISLGTVSHVSQDMQESEFRLAMNQDAMATEKLAEGIRLFLEALRNLRYLVDADLTSR